jgi:hypothetical protein
MIISFMSLDEGVSSKDLSKDKIGRDPLRQFPDKFNSSLQSGLSFLLTSTWYALLSVTSWPTERIYNFVSAAS